MIRKLLLAAGLSAALLAGSTTVAVAADAPPASVKLVYTPSSAGVNIAAALDTIQQAEVSEYDFTVVIAGQPNRVLTASSPSVMLYNILPGTQLRTWVQLKGSGIGTSPVYYGGSYTQPKSGVTSTSTATATPSTSISPTDTPSSSTPPASSTSSTTTTSSSPTVSSSSTATPPSIPATVSHATGFGTFINDNLATILISGLITLIVLTTLALLRARRKR